ncbi:hypothetical protein BDY24DRAFT_389501 [Mrakia frigida]|uniref:uncharacterized protein n=1 Tax=Mrakia frigida TaxID=29902 RepID=UPI003FCC0EAF
MSKQVHAPIRLSWDTWRLVFESASDAATLAALGRVSFDFLAGSSEFLYRRVEIKSVKKLESFFCARQGDEDDATRNRIDPHLSLSQTRHLHVDLSSLSSLSKSFNLQRAPEQSQNLLLLDTFRLSFKHHTGDLFQVLHYSLLPYLNPKAFELIISGRPPTDEEDDPLMVYDQFLEEWDRLEMLELAGGLPRTWDRSGYTELAGVPVSPSLRLHVATLLEDFHLRTIREFPKVVVAVEELFRVKSRQPGSVVLLARSEKEEKECEQGIGDLEAKLRPFFAVELLV